MNMILPNVIIELIRLKKYIVYLKHGLAILQT